MEINDKDYEEISSTAIVTSYPRTFTNIPCENKIYDWLNNHCCEEVILNNKLAPEYDIIDNHIEQLLEDAIVVVMKIKG